MSETEPSFWDKRWENPDYSWGDLEQEQFEFYIKSVPKLDGARILEIGSGSAKMASALAVRGAILTCTDFSSRALGIGQEHFKRHRVTGTFVRADMRSLPLPDDVFDLVYSSGVLEHYTPEEMTESISEMLRVSKPGAIVVNFVPYARSLFYRLAAWHLSMEETPIDTLEPIYRKLGCEEVGEFSCGFLTSVIWLGQCPSASIGLLTFIRNWYTNLTGEDRALFPGYVLGSWGRKPAAIQMTDPAE